MRIAAILLLASLLVGCGDDPAPTPPGPLEGELWHYVPKGLEPLLIERSAGAVAWFPPEVQAKIGTPEEPQLGAVWKEAQKRISSKITLSDDGRFELSLKQLQPDGWRDVTATGTVETAKDGPITFRVTDRRTGKLAPLEIEDTFTGRREGIWLYLDVLGRTIPYAKLAFGR